MNRCFFGLLLILVLTAFLYANSLSNPFAGDDHYVIFRNFETPESWTIRSLFQRSLFSTPPSETPYFRPLTLLTFALNYSLAGDRPGGYRAVNIVFHLMVVASACFLLARLTNMRSALFASLLFAVHPVHVQSVAFIASRSELLYAFSAFLSLIFWHSASTAKARSGWSFRGLALFCFFLGLFAKETMVVVPALALLMDLTFCDALYSRERLKQTVYGYLGFAVLFAIYLAFRLRLGFSLTMEGTLELNLLSRVLLAVKLFGYHVYLAFYPVHLYLFRTVEVPLSILEFPVIAGGLAIGILALVARLFWFTCRPISFGILWFFVSIMPVLNLTILNQPLMENWLYLPIFGLVVSFVSFIQTLAAQKGELRAAAFLLSGIAVLLSARTVLRNLEWKNPVRLFLANVEAYPDSSKAWFSLGDALVQQGLWSEAARTYGQGLKINPRNVQKTVALGMLLSKMGRDKEADRAFDEAKKMAPEDASLLYGLGFHLLKTGRDAEAVKALEKSLAVKPSVDAYHLLGSAYLRVGQAERAEEVFSRALSLAPRKPKLHSGLHADLAQLYWLQEKKWDAKEEAQLALRFDPNNALALKVLRNNWQP